jgi:hypothetical protein
MKRVWKSGTVLSIATLSLAALVATNGMSAETAPPADQGNAGPAKAAAPAAGPSSSAAGLTVFIDPVTKQIRPPTPEEAAALAAPMATKHAESAKVPAQPRATSRKGLMAIPLDDSHMEYMVVTRQPDGKLHQQCVTGAQKADDALATANGGQGSKSEKGPVPDAQ